MYQLVASYDRDLLKEFNVDSKLPWDSELQRWLDGNTESIQQQTLDFLPEDIRIECVRKAMELTGWAMVNWFEILAAAFAEAGRFEEAVQCQTKVIDGTSGQARYELETRLRLFEAGRQYRDQLKQ